MRIRLVSSLSVVLLLLCSFLSTGDVTVKRSATTQAKLIVADNLGNFYLVTGNNIERLNLDGKILRTYNDKNFGAISSVDATNPLRLLLFYKDFSRVLFLDNTMSLSGEPVRLDELGYPQTTLVATSNDNGFWIYDQQSFGLIRFDRDLKISQQTGNLSQVLGDEIKPNFLIEANNRVFLNDTARGILIFDVFGTYSKTIPVKHLTTLQADAENVYYFRNNWFHKVDLRTLDHDSLLMPARFNSGCFFKNHYFLLDSTSYTVAEKTE